MTTNFHFQIGDIVRIVVLHDGLSDAPPKTQRIYQNAFMRPLRIDAIDGKDGDVWVELNVNEDGTQATDCCCGHTLCLPPDEVELISRPGLESSEKAN